MTTNLVSNMQKGCNMSKHSKSTVDWEEALTDTDFGLIICGKTGRLKGLWIPDGKDEDEVPQPIVDICMEYFGVDPNQQETLH